MIRVTTNSGTMYLIDEVAMTFSRISENPIEGAEDIIFDAHPLREMPDIREGVPMRLRAGEGGQSVITTPVVRFEEWW